MVTKGEMLEGGGGTNWEVGIGKYTPPHTKSICDRDLRYSPGKPTHYSALAYEGKDSERGWLCVNMQLIRFAVRGKLTQHCKSALLQ